MKHIGIQNNHLRSYGIALLGGVLLTLSTLGAQGQITIRRNVASRQVYVNGQSVSFYSPYAAYGSYAPSRYASAVPTYNTAPGAFGSGVPPQSFVSSPQSPPSDALTAQYVGSDQLLSNCG